jgi:hypothetical protein
LGGGELPTSHPGSFTARKIYSFTSWFGCEVNLKSGLKDLEKKVFWPLSGIEPRILGYAACSLVTILNRLPDRVKFEETYIFLSPSINIAYFVCVEKFDFLP